MSDSSSVGLAAPAALLNGNERKFIFHNYNVIGRSENAFISIKDQLISRTHCIIEKSSDNSFKIRDMSSKGTFLNGKKMLKNEVYELQHRDKICLANLDNYTYTFMLNKRFKSNSEESEKLNFRLKEKMLNFDNTYSDNLKKLNSKLTQMESEKSDLKEKMENRLEEQETAFKREQLSLSTVLNETNEQKEEAERKLREMEASCELENKKLMEEVESKIADITKKEEELQQAKNEMELRYQKERAELGHRCRAEVQALKERLAEFEIEQERLQGETQEAEQKLKETKKILLECELEQFRLCEEKVEAELKLESKIIDLTKESTSKDEVVKNLEERLREKEKAEEKLKKEIEVLEEELQCSICAELFIEPTVLNCGHMFCKKCIEEWKTKKKICPMCRTKIVTSVRIFTVDTIIDKNVALLPAEARFRREVLIRQRRFGEIANENPVRAKKRRHYSHRAEVHHRGLTASVMTTDLNPIGEHALMVQLDHPAMDEGMELEVNVLVGDQPDDPFSWGSVGRVRTRARAQVGRGSDPWRAPAVLPVPVAAIDLTNIPPATTTTPATTTAPAIREPIDLTNMEPSRPSTSTSHMNTTIDLTSP